MANTLTLITSVALSASQSNITFSSIPSTYSDLRVILSVRTDSSLATEQLYIRFNGATSGYTAKQLYANGSSIYSDILNVSGGYMSLVNIQTAGQTSNIFSSTDIYIPSYANTSYTKLYLGQSSTEALSGATSALQGMGAGRLNSTSAITSIAFTNQDSANFISGSNAYLYGISNA